MSDVPATIPADMAAITKRNPRGAGRYPRAGKPAERNLTIRLTEDERERFQRAANAAELTLGDWIRSACEAHLRRKRHA